MPYTTAWVAPGCEGGYFSLAGAQSKFTLVRTPEGWGIPTGRTASTHIVKPGVTGLTRSDLNEHLTMRASAAMTRRSPACSSIERAIAPMRYARDSDKPP